MNPEDLYGEDGTPLVGRWPLDMALDHAQALNRGDRLYDVAERAAWRAIDLLAAEVERLRKLTTDAALYGFAYEYAPAGGPRLMLNPSDVRVYVRPDYVDDVTRLNAEVQRLEDFRRDVVMALVTEDQDEERTDAEVVQAAREAVTLAEAAGHWLSATDYAAQMGEAAGNGEPDADYAQAADAAVAAADALRDATVRWVCREWTEPPPVLTIAGRDYSGVVKSVELS